MPEVSDLPTSYDFLKQYNLDWHCNDFCRIVAKKQMKMASTINLPTSFEKQAVSVYMHTHDLRGAKTKNIANSLQKVYEKHKASII